MKIHTMTFDKSQGWSPAEFPTPASEHQLLLVFGSSDYLDQPEPVVELCSAFPDAHAVGCSTSGEILQTSIYDDSLCVALVEFDKTPLRSAVVQVPSMEGSRDVGRALAGKLKSDDLRGVMVFSDGLSVNGSELVAGINEILPEGVRVTGGLAGDGDAFVKTWVLEAGKPTPNVVSAVGFYGDAVHIGHGSKGGWDKFGPERKVTGSKNNVLFSLDNKPALALYKEYLGERAKDLPASGLLFPLALRNDDDSDKILVRTILSINEEDQSLTFAGDVPEGSIVRLMKANFDRLVEGAEEAALMTKNRGADGSATLAVAISCVGRRLVLGERSEEEVEATLDVLPENTTQIGFYSYGELSPFATGRCDLHNQTMTLTTIHEG